MIKCPYCDAENIPGVDLCIECGQSLADVHLTQPATELERSLLKDRLSALHPRAPLMMPHTTPLKDVLGFMVEKEIGCVFLQDGGRVVGVFTERDAYRRLGVEAREKADRPIHEFMTREPSSLTPEAKIAFAVRSMVQIGYRHVLIIDKEGEAQGVVSVRDIIKYLDQRLANVAG